MMIIHVVKKGDTLASVSMTYRVPLGLLAIWNALAPPYPLLVGQAILVLSPSGLYTVREGDTAISVARRFGITVRELYANNPVLLGGENMLFVNAVHADF